MAEGEGGVEPRRSGGGGCLKFTAALLAILVVIAAGFWFVGDQVKRQFLEPDPTTIAQASLQGLREQNRLSAFAARYVAVVTSTQSRFGLSAQKTLIMPGSVRYEVDLSKLTVDDLKWDAAKKKLSIKLPPIEVMGPEVDTDHVREYGEGGILMALTDAESRLDEANRKAAREELIRQAREPAPMKLARDATRRAIEQSMGLPLRAVGVNAEIDAYFPDEKRDDEVWDMSRRPEDVLANHQ